MNNTAMPTEPTHTPLKPCPFCGGAPTLSSCYEVDDRRRKVMQVRCYNCDFEIEESLPYATYSKMSPAQMEENIGPRVAKAWNTRAEVAPSPVNEALRSAPGGEHTNQEPCTLPPDGWSCTRGKGHDGPCAATPSLGQHGESALEVVLLTLPKFHPAKTEYSNLAMRLAELEAQRDEALEDATVAQVIAENRLAEQTERVAELKRERDEANSLWVAAIHHLNRLATWAQQDPTGPFEKYEIQQWVLGEIKSALGKECDPHQWEPSIFMLRAQLADLTALRSTPGPIEGCKLVALHTGDGWYLAVQAPDGNDIGMLEWPEQWPKKMTSEALRLAGFEIL